jgi:predicted acetyltransferase
MKTLLKDLKALYMECFSDSKECVDYLFSQRLGIHNAEYEYLNDKLAVAMYLVKKPLIYHNKQVFIDFVVGLATAAEQRKKGLALQLMRRSVEKSQAPFVMLYPAVKGFYEKMDFATISFDDKINYEDYTLEPSTAEKMLKVYERYIEGMDFRMPMTKESFAGMIEITRLDGGAFNMLKKNDEIVGFGNGEEGIALDCAAKEDGAMARITSPAAAFVLTDIDIPFGIKLTDGLIENNNTCFRVDKGVLIKTKGYDLEISVAELTAHFFGYKGALAEFFPCIQGYILERY